MEKEIEEKEKSMKSEKHQERQHHRIILQDIVSNNEMKHTVHYVVHYNNFFWSVL